MAINNEYVPINNQPTVTPRTVTGIFTKYIAKTLPLAFDESMSYYECLCALLEYLNETIVPDINNVNEGLEEVQNLYVTLQNYINNAMEEFETDVNNTVQSLEDFMNNYFDNLDVQEEINNKLDQMLEDGVLEQIIEQFLQLTSLICFDNVADMKASINLANGSYAKTLGYYSKNDGGEALYKIRTITNDDVVDEMFIIALNDTNLIAELITNEETNIKNLGARDNKQNDITPYFNAMYNKLNRVLIPHGSYLIHTPITISSYIELNILGNIDYDGSEYAFIIENCQNSNINIHRFDSQNGGLFDISPTGTVSFINFNIEYSYCKKQTFYFQDENGIITMLKLRGTRWQSSSLYPIELFESADTIASSYMSQIDIYDVDLLAVNNPCIKATGNHSTKTIGFTITNVDMENSKGIHCYNRVYSIGIFNCRLGEISYVQGWLTFNNYMPIVSIIGAGNQINPTYFTFNNLPDYGDNKSIMTNLELIDSSNNSTYPGGGIITSRVMKPYIHKNVWKSYNNENTSITLPEPNISGNLYNYFTINTESAITINIPARYYYDYFYINSTNAVDITIVKGSYSITIPHSEGSGTYLIHNYSYGIGYNKI